METERESGGGAGVDTLAEDEEAWIALFPIPLFPEENVVDVEFGTAPNPKSSPRASSFKISKWRARNSAPSSGGRRAAAGESEARVSARASDARSAKIGGCGVGLVGMLCILDSG